MNKFYLFCTFLAIITFKTSGQNRIGAHHWEYLKNYLPPAENETLKDAHANIIPLDNSAGNELSRTVFGYLPYWEYSTSKSYLRYDLLTHIALFSFSVNANGSINNPPGGQWPWTDVINSAHQNGVKVVMSVINFDITTTEMHNILTDNSLTLNFINSVKSKINAYNLDGVNIDFEASNISPSDRSDNINNFMKSLTDSIHALSPDLEVSFASPAVNWSGYWDLEGLAESCDYLFIMGYDFYGSWSDETGPTAPLISSVSSFHITSTIDVQYREIKNSNPDKLILGVPYFGPHWVAESANERARTVSFAGSERFRTAQPQSEIHGLKWSSSFRNSWYSYPDGNNFRQIWFDNDSSLALKYDLAISRNLKGVGMWALGYDGERSELWNLIDMKFGSGELPVPSVPINFSAVSLNRTSVKISFSPSEFAQSYEIYFSSDGQNFSLNREISSNSLIIDNLETLKPYYYKVRAKNSSGKSIFSETLSVIPSDTDILIVNGFDRIQSTSNTFDYIRYYQEPFVNLGLGFSSCSNEAVYNDEIYLNDFEMVFWMLLDESTADETFNQLEQQRVKLYLENGGKFFVSGAEIGWDLVQNGNSDDKDFYSDYLKAVYISDAPLNQSSTYYSVEPVPGEMFEDLEIISFDNGTHGTIDVDWPDAVSANSGASNIMKFVGVNVSSGTAGIAYTGSFGGSFFEGKLIYLSFPFETV
jgi:spore germination protein YaaH